MGTDIHSYGEYLLLGKWWLIGNGDTHAFENTLREPLFTRNYSLFTLLAGVRKRDGHPAPICEAKGLPTNVSFDVKQEYELWADDAHSTSWLTLKELMEVDYTKVPYLCSEFYSMLGHMIGTGKDPEQLRIVFWFDN